MNRTNYLENLRIGFKQLWEFFLKNKIKFALGILLVLFFQVVIQILMELECTSQDPTVRGLRIFEWAKAFFPGKYESLTDSPIANNIELFPHGIEDIDGRFIIQGAVYDCRFLSSMAAFASSNSGKDAIPKMIKRNENGTYTVTFPALKSEPITIDPLTEMEVRLYGHLRDRITNQDRGIWLAVIEKAYGKYRCAHMDLFEQFLLICKHAIFEMRFTPVPQLYGFGAAYGSKDDSVSLLLKGSPMKIFKTWGFEIGQFGLGKGYVTIRQLRSWLDRDKTMKEYEEEQHKALVASLSNGGIANAATEISVEAGTHGLHVGHAFSVLGYDPEKRILRICDPMGFGDYLESRDKKPNDGINDGVFLISIHDFNETFSHLGVSEPIN